MTAGRYDSGFTGTDEQAEEEFSMTTKDDVRREVVQEVVTYIDGDAENGPRTDVRVTDAQIEAEVHFRMTGKELGIRKGSWFGDAEEHTVWVVDGHSPRISMENAVAGFPEAEGWFDIEDERSFGEVALMLQRDFGFTATEILEAKEGS